MNLDNYEKELENAKNLYFGIKYIKCPILNNELVYFNQQGFRHILRKGKSPRPILDQLRRFSLLKHVSEAILSLQTEVSSIQTNANLTTFWSLTRKITNSYSIKIILRKVKDSRVHFYSIMDSGKQK